MIRTSQQTEQLDEAFARAQGKFEAAAKGNINPAFKSKYADISSIIEAILSHLNSEGIAVRQHPALTWMGEGDNRETFVTVTTRLTYKGQWEESDLSLPAVQRDRFDAQSCGSALTYACRYALQGIFCVRREDDDANQAVGRGSSEAAQAVGARKVEEIREKAKKAGKPLPEAPTPQLCVYPVGEDLYEITGEGDVMNDFKEALLLYGKRVGKTNRVTMTGNNLESFKLVFCREHNGILTYLKSADGAEAAKNLAEELHK